MLLKAHKHKKKILILDMLTENENEMYSVLFSYRHVGIVGTIPYIPSPWQ